MMQKFNDPGLNDHKVEHKVLIHVLKEYQKKVSENGFSMEILEMLKHWLMDHIMNLDKKYGIYLNQKGVS